MHEKNYGSKILFLSLLLWWYCTIFWKDGSFSSSKLVITFLRDLIFSSLSCTFTHVHTYIHIPECNLYFMHEQSSTIFHRIIIQNQNQNFLYILYVFDYNEERDDAHVLLRLICIFCFCCASSKIILFKTFGLFNFSSITREQEANVKQWIMTNFTFYLTYEQVMLT